MDMHVQVMFDQFLSSAEQKWNYQMAPVLLLPHGYDGQGPEHSSCRMERYLQMSDQDPDVMASMSCMRACVRSMAHHGNVRADQKTLIQDHNWQICNITTPANYFHALRRQIHRDFRKPLIVIAPKALLRDPRAASKISDFTDVEYFQEVFADVEPERKVWPLCRVCTSHVNLSCVRTADEACSAMHRASVL